MLTKRQIIEILNEQDESFIKGLFEHADRTRRKFVGDAVHLRGLIEFSNYCRRDCLYCGLRKSNSKTVRYRMTIAEILSAAARAG
jgi:biotin synthase